MMRWGGVFLGIFGLLSGTEEVQYQCDCHLLSLFYLLLFLRRVVRCVTLLSSGSWLKIRNAVLLELITSTFLILLCPCCRFSFLFFQSFLLQQYNMCLVLADSHVYKVHICVHMCNTRYSSNLLLWLLLIMMMILVSAPFFFLSWFLVDELCWFGCSQELKKGRWLFMILHTLFYFRGLWTF